MLNYELIRENLGASVKYIQNLSQANFFGGTENMQLRSGARKKSPEPVKSVEPLPSHLRITDLPVEILREILLLSAPYDASKLALSCKLLYGVLNKFIPEHWALMKKYANVDLSGPNSSYHCKVKGTEADLTMAGAVLYEIKHQPAIPDYIRCITFSHRCTMIRMDDERNFASQLKSRVVADSFLDTAIENLGSKPGNSLFNASHLSLPELRTADVTNPQLLLLLMQLPSLEELTFDKRMYCDGSFLEASRFLRQVLEFSPKPLSNLRILRICHGPQDRIPRQSTLDLLLSFAALPSLKMVFVSDSGLHRSQEPFLPKTKISSKVEILEIAKVRSSLSGFRAIVNAFPNLIKFHWNGEVGYGLEKEKTTSCCRAGNLVASIRASHLSETIEDFSMTNPNSFAHHPDGALASFTFFHRLKTLELSAKMLLAPKDSVGLKKGRHTGIPSREDLIKYEDNALPLIEALPRSIETLRVCFEGAGSILLYQRLDIMLPLLKDLAKARQERLPNLKKIILAMLKNNLEKQPAKLVKVITQEITNGGVEVIFDQEWDKAEVVRKTLLQSSEVFKIAN